MGPSAQVVTRGLGGDVQVTLEDVSTSIIP